VEDDAVVDINDGVPDDDFNTYTHDDHTDKVIGLLHW